MLKLKVLFLVLTVFSLSCEVERNKYDISSFCKGIEAFQKKHPKEIEGDYKFEDCVESRVVVIKGNGELTPIFSGKVLSYHQIGDKSKMTVQVEKYSTDEEICGSKKLIKMENIYEQALFTVDEEAYLQFTTLKECEL